VHVRPKSGVWLEEPQRSFKHGVVTVRRARVNRLRVDGVEDRFLHCPPCIASDTSQVCPMVPPGRMESDRILGAVVGVDLKEAPLHQLVTHNAGADTPQMPTIHTTQNELDGEVRHTTDQHTDDEQ
jgi:hypothetical protein